MSIPKNQHWVPRFYLKYFATPETKNENIPKVWIFEKEKSIPPRLVSTKDICFKRYLYSPINNNGEKDLFLEKILGRLEDALAPQWFSLANECLYISKDDPFRKGISLFVSSMILRNPDTRIDLENSYREITKCIHDEPDINDIQAIEINGTSLDFNLDDWDRFLNRKPNDHHRFFTDYVFSNIRKIAEQLLEKRWSIIFSDKPRFITSDKPVSINHLTKEKFGVDFGLGTEGSFVIFPLSPHRLLVMDDRHDEPEWQYYAPDDNRFELYNFLIWKNSKRLMISSRDINEVLREIDDEIELHADNR
ncbi:MAG: DUF4238 domain-containing protein [Methylomicrobium sp.]